MERRGSGGLMAEQALAPADGRGTRSNRAMAASPTPASASPIRLLLVDDHPLVRDGLRARLEAVPGFEVVGEAANAEEAHAQLESLQPTLVLMDVGIKGVNGIDLTAALLEREPALLVLMLCMYDNPEYVQRAMQAGARGYVLKDAPASEIIAAIEAVAGGGTFLSPAVSDAAVPQPGAAAAAVVARVRDPGGPGARAVQQAHRPRDGPQRPHGGDPPAEHQAQAVARGAGRADQVRGGARGQAGLSRGSGARPRRRPRSAPTRSPAVRADDAGARPLECRDRRGLERSWVGISNPRVPRSKGSGAVLNRARSARRQHRRTSRSRTGPDPDHSRSPAWHSGLSRTRSRASRRAA